MKNYSFTNKAVIRTPLGIKKTDVTWEEIQEIFKDKKNREALFIGSPNIHNALELWEKGEAFQTEDELKNLQGSLYKYVSRLSNRCTPFGLWATVSSVKMGKETHINMDKATIERTTKFDMYFLGKFLPEITKNKAIRAALRYFPNNSMYKVMDKYRYVEYYFNKDNVRCHKISEVDINEYLEMTLEAAKNGALISDIIKPIVNDGIAEEDAINFINQVIDSQFFTSEIEFTLTGDDYLEALLKTLNEKRFDFYEANTIKKLLTTLKEKITDLDTSVVNDPKSYKDIHKIIENQIQEADVSKLFQVDTYRHLPESSLSYSSLKKIRNAIVVLNKLQGERENTLLEDFKRKFQQRYEEYEQPLINVLDPDLGIGYGNNSGAKTPLVDKLAILPKYSKDRKVSWNEKTSFLFKKALSATKKGDTVINLSDEDINTFEEKESLYPDSFSTFFNIFHEDGVEKINLKSIWGPSANGLVGRFSHLNDAILESCNEIHEHDKALHPNKILAEIIHLPQARTGNILYRKFRRDYEIPYLGNSSLDKDNQIDVSDIYVSVKRNKIVLRSKKLNKEIIPRLGNAHNYSANALPIYHFLCDLQDQEQSGLAFSWGILNQEFDFLPRVCYKDVILSRATWAIRNKDIKHILSQKEENAIDAVRSFQKERDIPNVISFTQGDNEVVINFENDLSCKVFYLMLKGEKLIYLKEFFFKEETVTGNYCNEFVIPAYRNAPKEQPVAPKNKETNSSIQKASYSTGDEWLYYKFYCGERVGEKLLNQAIKPIVDELKAKNLIDKWFFIRYIDKDGHHLRFRVHLNDLQNFSECILTIKKHIQPFEDNLLIWKTQTDTYLRELQRYGFESIDPTEELFFNDSECTVKFADMIEGDSGEQIRWLFALLSMDHLLSDFGITLKEKIKLLDFSRKGFGKEFNKTGALNKQVNELYSNNMSTIESFLSEEKHLEAYAPIWAILEERSIKNKPIVKKLLELNKEKKLATGLSDVVLSYLHMVCNRIFLAKQRIHEMVVYDMLFKYYNKQLHTQKKSNEKTLTN